MAMKLYYFKRRRLLLKQIMGRMGSLLLLLLLVLPFHAASAQQCSLEGNPGPYAQKDEGYVCFWQQGMLRQSSKTGASTPTCIFVVRDPAFLDILAFDSKLELIAHADAHEGGVYFPDDDSFYFTTKREEGATGNTKIMKVYLSNGSIEIVANKTEVPNGMVLDRNGFLIVCQQGVGEQGGYMEKLELSTLKSEVVADNWFRHPFNSPNDVVVKGDGSTWFTDPDYGWVQGFKKEPQLKNHVYRVSPSGVVDVVADGFVKPNGLAFSHDEKRLYVTDTGSTIGDGTFNPLLPHSVTAFDVAEDGATLHNRRLFASVSSMDGSYEGVGCPDGIKVDTMGRVYVANPDGVHVFSSEGELLGVIRVPGAANIGFAGRHLDELIILNDTSIHAIHLAARGAGLHYAAGPPRDHTYE